MAEPTPTETADRAAAPPTVPVAAATAAELEQTSVRLRRYLRFLGCERALAADFAQDALLAGHDRFAGALPPLPWLLTTARNAFRMHLRRNGRLQPTADLEALHGEWQQLTADDGGDGRLLALQRCLAELPPRARRALELRYRDDAPRAAMARALGLGDEGVKSLLSRLRLALAACIQRRLRS